MIAELISNTDKSAFFTSFFSHIVQLTKIKIIYIINNNVDELKNEIYFLSILCNILKTNLINIVILNNKMIKKFKILPRSDAAQLGLSITVGVYKQKYMFLLQQIVF